MVKRILTLLLIAVLLCQPSLAQAVTPRINQPINDFTHSDVDITAAFDPNQQATYVGEIGDINGDGFNDIAIGAPSNDDFAEDAGKTYIILGKETGWEDIDLDNESISYVGEHPFDNSGFRVNGIGDINEDTFDDFAISAPHSAGGTVTLPSITNSSTVTAPFVEPPETTTISMNDFSVTGTDKFMVVYISYRGLLDDQNDAVTDISFDTVPMTQGCTSRAAGYVNEIWYLQAPEGVSSTITANFNNTVFDVAMGVINYEHVNQNTPYGSFACSNGPHDEVDWNSSPIVYIQANSDQVVFAGASTNSNGSNNTIAPLDGQSQLWYAETQYLINQGTTKNGETGTMILEWSGLENWMWTTAAVSLNGVNTGVSRGEVYIIYGKADGWAFETSLSTADVSFVGEDDDAQLGWSPISSGTGQAITPLGDINNGGVPDFAIASNNDLGSSPTTGKTYLMFGEDIATWGGSVNQPIHQVESASFVGAMSYDFASSGIAGIGDINADGIPDMAIGAYEHHGGTADEGKTYIIFGSATGWGTNQNLSVYADASFIGQNGTDHSGHHIADLGDINGDTIDDFAIGAVGYNTMAGKVYIIFGSATAEKWQTGVSLATADASFLGEEQYAWAGFQFDGLGDVNDDGYDDMAIGAPEQLGRGKTYIIFGKADGWANNTSLALADSVFASENGGDESGWFLAGLGDVNGDGYDDFISAFSSTSYLGFGGPNKHSILNLDVGLDALNEAGENIEAGTDNYAAEETITVKDATGLMLSEIYTDLRTDDRDWAIVDGGSNTTTGKAVVTNLATAPGTSGTHTLYIPKRETDIQVRICPDATSIEDISVSCTNGYTAVEADDGVSVVTVAAQDYWKVEGLTGTGGQGEDGTEDDVTPSPTPTPDTTSPNAPNLDPGPDDKTYTANTRITFSWYSQSHVDTSTYSLSIDNGSTGDFSIDGLNSAGSDQSTNRYQLTYTNFSDGDDNNNTLSLFTKSSTDWPNDQNDGVLKEGNRSWQITARDAAGNAITSSLHLFVDLTAPYINDLKIDGESVTNEMSASDTTPTFSGRLVDPLAGDNDENKVASGPKSIIVTVEKLLVTGLYQDYKTYTTDLPDSYWEGGVDAGKKITDNTQNLSNKYADFSYTVPEVLPLGDYRVTISGQDKVDHKHHYQFVLHVKDLTGLLSEEDLDTVTGLIDTELPSDQSGSASARAELTQELEIVNQDRTESPKDWTESATAQSTAIASNLLRKGQILASAVVKVVKEEAVPLMPAIATVVIPTLSIWAVMAQYSQQFSWKILLRVLQALGLLSKGSPQGFVFDSLTHQPIAFALLTFSSKAKYGQPITETVVTDMYGVYQGIKLFPGEYSVNVGHQGSVFPTKKRRPLYLSLVDYYKGEPFSVKSSNTQQVLLIPLDTASQQKPINWKARLRLLLTRIHLRNIVWPMSALSMLFTFFYPTPVNIAVLGLYAVLSVWQGFNLLKLPNIVGKIQTKNGKAVAHALIRISTAADNRLVALVTSDKRGLFKVNVPQGEYQVGVVKPGFIWMDQDQPMSFKPIEVKKKQNLALTMVDSKEFPNFTLA